MTDHPQHPALPRPLYAVTQDARLLIEAGKPVEAIARLAAALQRFDPVAAAADPDLIDAAALFAALAVRVPVDQLSWARYAYRASLHAYGPVHDVTVRTGDVLSDVLQLQRLCVDAIAVLDAQAGAYIRRRDTARATGTRSQLARLLHDDGRCDQAEQQMTAALTHRHPDNPALRIPRAVATLVHITILAGCGRHHAAEHLARSQQQLLQALQTPDPDGRGRRAHMSAIALAERHHAPVCTRPLPSAPRPPVPLSTYERLLGLSPAHDPGADFPAPEHVSVYGAVARIPDSR